MNKSRATIAHEIHHGDITHHHDQSITPHNLSTTKTIPIVVSSPNDELLFSFAIVIKKSRMLIPYSIGLQL